MVNCISGILKPYGFGVMMGGRAASEFSMNICRSELDIPATEFPSSISNVDELEKTLAKIEQITMFVFDNMSTISGIDSVMNGDTFSFIRDKCKRYRYMPVALVVARLSDNKDFENLTVDLIESGKHWNFIQRPDDGREYRVALREAWNALVNHLRNEVKPL